MPCDSIQTSKVQFIQGVTDIDTLIKAMKKHGYSVTKNRNGFDYYHSNGDQGSFNSKTGEFTTTGYYTKGVDVDSIKRGYSHEIVAQTAEGFGWQIEWSTNPVTGFEEAEVIKRN
jgi:hypothetical protein